MWEGREKQRRERRGRERGERERETGEGERWGGGWKKTLKPWVAVCFFCFAIMRDVVFNN